MMEDENPEVPIETKEDLEKEKLRLEIAELNRQWWKKPAYIAAVFPTLLALTTLVYGFANGYFQASFIKLDNQKHTLQKEIDGFNEEKVALTKQNELLKNEQKETQAFVKKLRDDIVRLEDWCAPENRELREKTIRSAKDLLGNN